MTTPNEEELRAIIERCTSVCETVAIESSYAVPRLRAHLFAEINEHIAAREKAARLAALEEVVADIQTDRECATEEVAEYLDDLIGDYRDQIDKERAP